MSPWKINSRFHRIVGNLLVTVNTIIIQYQNKMVLNLMHRNLIIQCLQKRRKGGEKWSIWSWNLRLIDEKSWVNTCLRNKRCEMLDHGKLLSDQFFFLLSLLLLPVHSFILRGVGIYLSVFRCCCSIKSPSNNNYW